jgi:uncharacterized membrane protein
LLGFNTFNQTVFMDNNITFSLMLFVFGIIFLIIAPIEYFFPPKNRNQKGYRSKNSLKSQEHWDFAQKHHAKMIFFSALFFIFLSFIGQFFSLSDKFGFIASLIIIGLSFLITRLKTEKAIRDKFD